MEELPLQDTRNTSKSEKDDITYNNIRTNCGICCICHKSPFHSKNYYGHVFCKECFYKYIFTQPKIDCSGDLTKKEKDSKEDKKEDKKEVVEEKEEVVESTAAMEVAK